MDILDPTSLISADTEKYGILFDLLRRSSDEETVLTGKLLDYLGKRRYHSLLDIGAGDGSITQKLMPYFDEVTAIDRLDSNIYFLKSLGIDAKKSLWEDYQTDASFDIILASHLIYYFPLGNWVNEMIRMREFLEPDGQLLVVVNSAEGEYADFLRQFYKKFHKTNLEQVNSTKLVTKLRKQGIDADYDSFQSSVVFENKAHFLALCRFLIDCDFDEKHPLNAELSEYYHHLAPLEHEQRRILTLSEDLIVIKK